MNMRTGGTPQQCRTKAVIRNMRAFQPSPDPAAFRPVRSNCHIHAPAVIEAEGRVRGRFSEGADGQRLQEFLRKRGLESGQLDGPDQAARSVIAKCTVARLPRSTGTCIVGAGHFD